MFKPNLQEAILELNKDAKFRIYDSDVKKIQWLDNTKAISESKIKAKLSELQTAFEQKLTTKEETITSAKSKLTNLGFTDDEITIMLGE